MLLKIVGAAGVLLMVSGCATVSWWDKDCGAAAGDRGRCGASSAEVAAGAAPVAVWNDFRGLLIEGYRRRVKTEDYEHDFVERERNLSRVARLKRGEWVGPEMLSYRRLPLHAQPALQAARERLMQALSGDARRRMPVALAEAQVNFDCWMEEQEENRQQHDIDACRLGFEAAMRKLDMLPAKARSSGSACDCEVPGPYIVYFDLDQSVLTPSAMTTLQRVRRAYAQLRPARVIVEGHTDRAADMAYNDSLAQRRVRAVVAKLVALGVPRKIILTQGFGERRPRIRTPDGVREAENRRVEIRFSW